ncbi:MAG: radical SAM protein [Ruminococcus sp.]|nr:radical SAM protein [Ruminococcus sp.]
MKAPKHANVALFIPFNGCPHRCSFCDQRSITGKAYQPTPDDVRSAIETALDSLKENSVHSEIAFFGGSFTAIDRKYMRSLLGAAALYIDRFKGIRISTRPDCIDEEILSLLKTYHVTAIELGAQSMDDTVLLKNDRGHSAADVRRASALIKRHCFELGLQMMTGLYGSTPESDAATAKAFIELHPDTVRIYPTIVMKGTRLGELYEEGTYQPQSLNSAVELCAKLIELFTANGVRVIRVGLHDSESLKENRLAGPYHPAFRELCESRIMLEKAVTLLRNKEKGKYTLRVHPKCRSKMTGNQKANLVALRERGYEIAMIEDERISDLDVEIV